MAAEAATADPGSAVAAEAATVNPGSASSDPAPPPTATSVSPTAPGVGEPTYEIGMRSWAPQRNLPVAIGELKEKALTKYCWLVLEDGVHKSKRMRFVKCKMELISRT